MMKKIRLTEQQLIFLTEAKTPGRVRIWNNSGYLKPGEKELVEMYPQYFIDFITRKNIEELEKSEDANKILHMSHLIKGASNEDEKNRLKAEMTNWLLNHELYSIYLHRFVQDYIIPNVEKQNVINKLKRGKRISDEDFKRIEYEFNNGYKDIFLP